MLLASLSLVRRLFYKLFLIFHCLFALTAVVALYKHLEYTRSKASVFPGVALLLWGSNTIMRMIKMAYHNIGGSRDDKNDQAAITHYFHTLPIDGVSAIRMEIKPRHPLKIQPGQYFYLFLSDLGTHRLFEAYPFVILWWDDSLNAMNLSFLIQPEYGITRDLIAKNSVRSVIIDGPYRKNLHLEDYETVILVAKGIGITGILLYIRHMTYRRLSTEKNHTTYRRDLITNKIDVYWVLEDNCQEDWISDWIVELEKTDSKNVSIFPSYITPANTK